MLPEIGKLSQYESLVWQTYYHKLFNKGWFYQIQTWIKLTQEATYRKLFKETLRQWNRSWTKIHSKPVACELVSSQNCVAKTFASILRDMTQIYIYILHWSYSFCSEPGLTVGRNNVSNMCFWLCIFIIFPQYFFHTSLSNKNIRLGKLFNLFIYV